MDKSKSDLLKEHLKNLKNEEVSNTRQPEYQRLNLEPISKMNNPAEDALLVRNRRNQNIKPSPTKSSLSNERLLNAQLELSNRQKQTVMQNKPTVEAGDDLSQIEEDISYDDIIVPDMSRPSSLKIGGLSGFNHDQLWSEAADLVKPHAQTPQQIQDINENQYCLILKGKLVKVSDTIEELEVLIESLFFDKNSEFPDLEQSDFAILKRLPLKIGVIIKE